MSMRRWVLAGILTVGLVGPLGALPADAAAMRPHTDVVGYVDPLIGTANGGNTYPGAVRPFGMLSWSPTSTAGDQTGTGAANGYAYDTTRIRGFSLTHVNGAGCFPGAAGDVPIMPYVGEVTTSPSADTKDEVYASDFRHDDEVAEPGRYRLGLANGVRTDLAVTTRAGVGAVAFPRGSTANLLFRTSNSLNGSEDAEITIDPATRTVSGSVLTGGFCGRRANGGGSNKFSYYRLYFTAALRPGLRPHRHLGRRHRPARRDHGHRRRGLRDRGGARRPRLGRLRRLRHGSDAAGHDADRALVHQRPGGGGQPRRRGAARRPRSTKAAAEGRKVWNAELRRIDVGGGTPGHG